MDFRKELIISQSDLKIDYRSQLLLLGSCFIENIGSKLINHKFKAIINPFGVLYNPISIAQSLRFLIEKKVFTEDDIFLDMGLYNSLFFHSSFANAKSDLYLSNINNSVAKASYHLLRTDVLLITFGTAFIYTETLNNEVVANCHKLPASRFNRSRLTISDIVVEWSKIIDSLKQVNPQLRIVFTVSPIRHLRDGEHQNQLSKSILLLAIDEIMNLFSNTYYFPSFEILMDDLRDYRFYVEDMVHPNDLTINYIWKKFGEAFFDNTTKSIMNEWTKLDRSLRHRPFNENTPDHKQFLKQTLLKLEIFSNKYPYFECANEVALLKNKLAQNCTKE